MGVCLSPNSEFGLDILRLERDGRKLYLIVKTTSSGIQR
jgi:hypothetical protein